MTYRALFAADIHAGNQLPWGVKDPTTLIADRLHDIIDILTQMSDYANANALTDIWILGDLIDKRLVDAVTLKLVIAKLMEMKAQGLVVRLTPGNHESGDAVGKHFTLDAFADMGFWVAGISDSPRNQISLIEPVDGFEVWAMPYLPAARAAKMIETGPQHMPTLALIHQTIKGGMVGGWVSPDGLDPEMLEASATHVLSGHFHSPQTIGKHVHYLGAPVQHSFSDAGDNRGFWDIEWMGKFCKRTLVPVRGAPQFHEMSWDLSGKLPDTSHVQSQDYVNLKVIGPSTEVKKQWITVEQWATELRSRCRLVRPIPVHTAATARQRISLDDAGQTPTWDRILSKYLDSADCTGLNRQALESLGKELMSDADK